MREHGSFAVPLMHYWSLPCAMVSDEGRCIIDRLHIALSPWLNIHYATCALNFNYTNNLKRLDLNTFFSVFDIRLTYGGSSVCIKGAQRRQMTLYQLVLPLRRIKYFRLRTVIFAFDFGSGFLWCTCFPSHSSFFCLSDILKFPSSVTRRIPILLDPQEPRQAVCLVCVSLQISETPQQLFSRAEESRFVNQAWKQWPALLHLL